MRLLGTPGVPIQRKILFLAAALEAIQNPKPHTLSTQRTSSPRDPATTLHSRLSTLCLVTPPPKTQSNRTHYLGGSRTPKLETLSISGGPWKTQTRNPKSTRSHYLGERRTPKPETRRTRTHYLSIWGTLEPQNPKP